MALKIEEKEQIIKYFARHESDTGSPEVQYALLRARIAQLQRHLAKHKKDYQTQRTLLRLVAKMRKLRSYMLKKYPERYEKVKRLLGLSK